MRNNRPQKGGAVPNGAAVRLRSRRTSRLITSLPYLLMCAPTLIYFLLFHYLPISGVVIAFKDYNYRSGIFGSPWAGFKYFKYFFESNDALRVISNTMIYSVVFHIIGTVAAVLVAVLLYEIVSRKALKYYQTTMMLPYFISWVLVAYVGFTLLSSEQGVLNQIIRYFGGEGINWYNEPKYWPVILTSFHVWKNVGQSSIVYYAALMGVDAGLFEAAKLDGANRVKQIWHVSLPAITPIICMMTILAVGQVMFGNFGLFYQLPMDSGALYPVTDVIDTYVFRGLQAGYLSQSAVVGLFQSAVGFVLVLVTNGVTKKINPDNAMF